MLFADDIVIFMNIVKESLKNLCILLKEYEDNLGEKINSSKSYFYTTSKVQNTEVTMIEKIIG